MDFIFQFLSPASKHNIQNYFCMFLQVINFSSTTIAVFIGVVGILSIVAQVTHSNSASAE